MRTYTSYFTINFEVEEKLEKYIQELVYKVRNNDLDYANKKEIDAFEHFSSDIGEEIDFTLSNEGSLDEIETIYYGKVNKDTGNNEVVVVYIEVTEVKEEEEYNVKTKGAEYLEEPI